MRSGPNRLGSLAGGGTQRFHLHTPSGVQCRRCRKAISRRADAGVQRSSWCWLSRRSSIQSRQPPALNRYTARAPRTVWLAYPGGWELKWVLLEFVRGDVDQVPVWFRWHRSIDVRSVGGSDDPEAAAASLPPVVTTTLWHSLSVVQAAARADGLTSKAVTATWVGSETKVPRSFSATLK